MSRKIFAVVCVALSLATAGCGPNNVFGGAPAKDPPPPEVQTDGVVTNEVDESALLGKPVVSTYERGSKAEKPKDYKSCASIEFIGRGGDGPLPNFERDSKEQKDFAQFLVGQVFDKCSGMAAPDFWPAKQPPVEEGKLQCLKESARFDRKWVCWKITGKPA